MAELRCVQDALSPEELPLFRELWRLPDGFHLLPRVRPQGTSALRQPDEIDWVVIGPGGLAWIEYRAWHGSVSAAGVELPWSIRSTGGSLRMRPSPLQHVAGRLETVVQTIVRAGLEVPHQVMILAHPARSQVQDPGICPVVPLGDLVSFLLRELGGNEPRQAARMADALRLVQPAPRIGAYRPVVVLERTAERATMLAHDTLRDRHVLLHEILEDPLAPEAERERQRTEWMRELKLAMALQHPGISRVEQVVPHEGRIHLVAPFDPQARPLSEWLDERSLSVSEVLNIIAGTAEAIAHAHRQGVVHRNLRPSSIEVSPGAVRVTDFRLAKAADGSTRSSLDLRRAVHENPYAAPEFRLGSQGPHRVDGRADVFALAAIAYHALTGKPPAHLDEKYWQPPSATHPEVSRELDEVLHRALRFDPQQRTPTVQALARSLARIQGGEPEPESWRRYPLEERRLVKRTRNSLLYRAIDAETGREVALKRLLSTERVDPEARQRAWQRLEREVALVRRLVHPRIVTVEGAFLEDDDAYLVMEWLDGHELREHLDGTRPPLSVPEALEVTHQIGEALAHAHELGILHGDVKPENVLLSSGRAVLIDFGLASVIEDAIRPPGSGTPRYVAPEVLHGGACDARSDGYSLAVMTYELLTGHVPLLASPQEGAVPPAPPSHLNLAVPTSLDRVLLRMLAHEPEERYPAMLPFLDALSSAMGDGLLPEAPWVFSLRVAGFAAVGFFVGGGVIVALLLAGVLPVRWVTGLLPAPVTGSPDPAAVVASSSLEPSTVPALAVASEGLADPFAVAEATPTEALPTSPPLELSPASPPSATPGTAARPGRWREASLTQAGVTWTVSPERSAGSGTLRAVLSIENAAEEAVSLDPAAGWALLDGQGNRLAEGQTTELGASLANPVAPGEDARGELVLETPVPPGVDQLRLLLRDSRGEMVELVIRR
ncbi:MAG: protein kinase [bacterium]|nr:protein kinase [bacterium]